MNLARKIALASAAALLAFVAVSQATAQPAPESARYFGTLRVDAFTHNSTWAPGPVTDATGDVYDNIQAPANFGLSSTDLASQFGDRVSTIGQGLLAENDFTIYNSGSSAGNLLTTAVQISFYNPVTNVLLGAYLVGLDFGTGLPPTYYTQVTVTNLALANINLNTQDVVIIQQLVSPTGPADRLGIVSLDPPSVGSSPNTMFINSATLGPSGFYTIGNPPQNANPGYRINVSPAVPATPSTWGHLKAMYH